MNVSQTRRIPNFTSHENELLIELVNKYSDLLDSKKTDFISNKLKDTTWVKIGNEFNSRSAEYWRSAKSLRCRYENLKKKWRRDGVPNSRKNDRSSYETSKIAMIKEEGNNTTEQIFDDNINNIEYEENTDNQEDEQSQDLCESYPTMSNELIEAQLKCIEQKAEQGRIEHELRCEFLARRLKQQNIEHNLKCEALRLDIMLKKKLLDA